jgi:2-polyprenyl-6-methoxyphenol hydroxylase-like FAD-dependent oxidoreductase
MVENLCVLIIGGGIAGMSAAIALREAGVDVDLVERDPHWRVYGAGITITGPTLRAMRRLGVYEQVAAEGYVGDGIDVCSVDGRRLFQIDTQSSAFGGLPSAGGILRPTLHKILSQRVLQLRAGVRLGVCPKAFSWTPDKALVTFSDGSARRYDLVVGADGVNSDTRRMLFPDAPAPVYAGQMCWRLMTDRHPDVDRRMFFLGGPLKVGVNPVSRDQMYMFCLEASDEPLRRDGSIQHAVLRALLEDYGGILRDVREAIGPRSNIICRPLETVLAGESWVHRNVLLIGDAAHAATPQLASGAGMGIEDGLVLAQEVAAGDDLRSALARFMERRYPRCKIVVEASLEISRLERARSDAQAQARVLETALDALNKDF